MNPPLEDLQRNKAITAALALLKQEKRAFWWNRLLAFFCWGVALITLYVAILSRNGDASINLPPLGISLVCLLSGAAALSRSRSRALPILMKYRDVRAIGPLIDALHLGFAGERRAIVGLLTQLLPRMRASDATFLTPVQRSKLTQELDLSDIHRETDYVLAILKALEQIGDEKALPAVKRLARGGPEAWQVLMQRSSDTWQEQRVRDAAWNCHQMLQERLAQQRVSHTLLRPAAGSTDDLLRAASAGESDPAQLLRSTDAQADG